MTDNKSNNTTAAEVVGVNTVPNQEEAEILKVEGNNFLKNFKYALAADKYTLAIELCPTAILYSNRAQALIKIESYGLAIQDANEAIK